MDDVRETEPRSKENDETEKKDKSTMHEKKTMRTGQNKKEQAET